MIGRSKDYPKRLLEWWVSAMQRHARWVIVVALLSTAGILFYSIANFRINVDTDSMISEKLPFRKLESDYSRAFPQQTDNIVAVIDGDTAEQAVLARKRLAEKLRKETNLFRSVEEPGGGSFFEKNGLLYLKPGELEDFGDTLAQAQPLLALLSQDMSLHGLFSALEKALTQSGNEAAPEKRLDLLFSGMGDAFDHAAKGLPYRLSWQKIMLGDEEVSKQLHQFVILRPYLNTSELSSGEVPFEAVRHAVKELGLDKRNGVTVRLTGDVALNQENLDEVKKTVGAATFVSLFLVALILYFGLGRSGRLVFASLTTLIVGLIWTTGFAIAFIGSLNLISVTFAVLFVGLGIDYSIQFCLRYRELMKTGLHHENSIVTTAKGVGRSLLVSCVTIAIGFYSFVPTAYAGVGELGLISGTGMFISFFANLTLLPAILTLLPLKKSVSPRKSDAKGLLNLPYRHYRIVVTLAAVLGLASAVFLPRVRFDYNPLNLYDRKSEAIAAIKELFKDPDSSPWTISVLADGKERTEKLADKLRGLKEVRQVITPFDFIPDDQQEKLGILSDLALYMPPKLKGVAVKHLSYEEGATALNGFEKSLKAFLSAAKTEDLPAKRLYESIQRFKTATRDRDTGSAAFASLESALLSNLPPLFDMLDNSMQAAPIDGANLPADLIGQYVAKDGRYRIQVFPKENLMNRQDLESFVRSVRSVAPGATDAPVTIYESGRAVVSSFRQATLSAIVVIAVYLLIELRNLFVTGLILAPLVLAMLLTSAASVLLGIPLNFANVIVVPLLLGIGVHSAIIFILRYWTEPPADGNMLRTSTARAILLSTLTLFISTGSLAFSAHRGIASMGMILTICLAFLMLSTLILLPALLYLSRNRLKRTV
jgi:hopanoid biosynthesis associated RND transporter like protein HpnN